MKTKTNMKHTYYLNRSNEIKKEIEKLERSYKSKDTQGYAALRYFRVADEAIKKVRELREKASYYEKLAKDEKSKAIRLVSDSAMDELQEELRLAIEKNERVKAINSILRKKINQNDKRAMLLDYGVEESVVDGLLSQSKYGHIYLTGHTIDINRIKSRIAELEFIKSRGDIIEQHNGFEYLEDQKEGRIMLIFDGVPSEEERDYIKKHGFKWSPTRSAWVRMLTMNGIHAGIEVVKELDRMRNSRV